MKILNVDPLQAGGIPPKSVLEKIIPYFKGYPMCLYCTKDVHTVRKPNIKRLIEELQEFINSDYIRLHHGAREAAFTAIFALYKKHKNDMAPFVVLDGNTHYSMILAVERAELTPILTKVEESDKKIVYEDFKEKIEKVLDNTGKPPLAVILNYPDGKYGNLPDAKKVSNIASKYGTYLILDAAYSIGRMPFDMKELGADIAIGSAHKSMATIGPLGILGFSDEVSDAILRESKYKKNKELEFLGCSSRGLPTIVLMYVMDYLKDRVKEWPKKVKLANYMIDRIESELGFSLQGEKPHNHDLLNFLTDRIYQKSIEIGDRYFLYKELKKRGIIGIKPGITKIMKLSTYLLNKDEINYFIESLREIIGDYNENK